MEMEDEWREDAARFGRRIHALRAERDWSQEELAHRAGINPKYLSDVEWGKRNIAFKNVFRIVAALDVPMGSLFAGDNDSLPAAKRTSDDPKTH